MSSRRRLFLISFFVAVIFALDQATKWLTHEHLPAMGGFAAYPYGGIGVFSDFFGIELSFSHLINFGTAWGLFSGYPRLIFAVRVVVIFALLVSAFVGNRNTTWMVSLACVIGGAFSNVVDRFTYGHVVDMIHFVFWGYHFPVFNVADSFVCIGVTGLLYLSWHQGQQKAVASALGS